MTAGTAAAESQATNAPSFRAGALAMAFDDDYFAALDRVRPLHKVAALPLQDGPVNPYANEFIGLAHFLGKAYEAVLLVDALERHGLRRRFGRALDIGAGAALQTRFMRACGLAAHNEAIDIYDGRARCPEGRFWRLLLAGVGLHAGFRLFSLLPAALQDALAPRARRNIPLGRVQFGLAPDTRHFTFAPRPGASLDRYTVGDVFDCTGQYDLVTSFMALDYFDFDRIAAKVSSLLAPGGVFAFLVSYWWYPINNTLLFGRFPYLLQRLAPADALRYYREVHPALPIEGVERRLGYSDQRRLTVGDYEEIALSQGLRPVAAVRLHPDPYRNDRAVLGPFEIDRRPGSELARVLADARRWKPRLELADLLTSHVLMVFQK
jgi:SAM-dependent methyltransferase